MKTICVMFLVLALALTARAGGNLLINPGFETGDLSGWSVGGKNGGFGVAANGVQLPVTSALPGSPDFFFESWQNVRSGNFAAYGITAGDPQSFFSEYVSFLQSLTLAAGTYHFGFFLSTDNENGGVGFFSAMNDGRLGIYVDGNQLSFDIAPPDTTPLTSTWLEFDAQAALTAGTHDIEFRISAGGTKRVGVSLDDAWVTAVPEPSGEALIILGIISLTFSVRMSGSRRAA
jgi:hypothetical protein